MDKVEFIVAGAGVVGLAIARRLGEAGRETLIIEQEGAYGTGISARNSEVIHAGLYYPPGSLKARLCRTGRDELYRYCAERHIGHAQIGKILVATDDSQLPKLEAIQATACENGVDDLAMLDQRALKALEPEIAGVAALLSPSSGIVDSHGLMTSLLADAEDRGATIVLGSRITAVEAMSDNVVITVGSDEPYRLACRWFINAAGLGSVDIAAKTSGLPAGYVPQLHLAKGNYFSLSGRSPFRHLVYPLPEPGGLGVHATLDLAGRVRFGPDVEWIDHIDYEVDPDREQQFTSAIRRYWPNLGNGALTPDYSGIRPKLQRDGDADFRIDGPRVHGVEGVIHLFGIESPGLTSSLAIAEHVARLAGL